MSTHVVTEEELARARGILALVDNPGPDNTRETVLLGALSGAEMLGFIRGRRERMLKFEYDPTQPCGILSLARALVLAGSAGGSEAQFGPPQAEMMRLMYGFEHWVVRVVRFAEVCTQKETRDRVWKLLMGPWPSEGK